MTDTRSRLLARDASTGLDPQAEARLLVERLRNGTLTRERLELAAYCGHGAAWEAAGRPWFGAEGERRGDNMGGPWEECSATIAPLGLATWVRGLARWDDGAHTMGVRVAVAACLATWRALEPTHENQRPLHWRSGPAGRGHESACRRCDGMDAPRLSIVAAGAWLACPCDWHAQSAVAAGQLAGETIRWWGMLALLVDSAKTRHGSGARCAALCVDTLDEIPNAEALVRTAIRDALTSWALS